jgi:hypothetical protein
MKLFGLKLGIVSCWCRPFWIVRKETQVKHVCWNRSCCNRDGQFPNVVNLCSDRPAQMQACVEPCTIWGSHICDYEEFCLWDITLYGTMKVNQCFGGTYYLQLQSWRVRQTKQSLLLDDSCWFLAWLAANPRKCKLRVSPHHHYRTNYKLLNEFCKIISFQLH